MDSPDVEDNVVTRALRSVLDQVPTMPDTAIPESGSARQQPWADVAVPTGTDKRSIEELVAEFEQRVAQSPGATIAPNPGPSPSDAYYDHFTNAPAPAQKRKRRRRGRRVGPAAASNGQPATPRPRPQPAPSDGSAAAPRRRRRRRRGPRPASPPPE